MLFLAYDGSLNGDWVARYAIRFAAHDPQHTLILLHVAGATPPPELPAKLERLEQECREQGVTLTAHRLAPAPDVPTALLRAVPPESDSLIVCGTRVRSRRQALLAGTVSEQLLRRGRFPVLAVRVVQPGLLGVPHDLLLPLAGPARGFASARPFVRRFLPDLRTLHLLHAVVLPAARLQCLAGEARRALRAEAGRHLNTILEEIRRESAGADLHLDGRVILCADWAHELLLQASRLKTRLLLLGASERSPLYRLLHGDTLERVLRDAPCDVAVYRAP